MWSINKYLANLAGLFLVGWGVAIFGFVSYVFIDLAARIIGSH